ncbi:MAG: Tim44 domain-containing protein [Alcaligenaceae bacterium]|nr:Tim44 domain-containing protein [Alcaligenaceae bacterium]
MSRRFSRFLAVALLAVSTVGMVAVSFDDEARRMSGGSSFGRQSSNVTQQRQATTPPAATTTQRSASSAAPAAGAAAAGTAAKSGMSRFLGPIAGIAAGLGIAALLSSMGLSGAFLEMISSLLLIGLLVFAVLFIVRRLRGGAATPAVQGAGGMQRMAQPDAWQPPQAQQPASVAPVTPVASAAAASADPADPSWFIPGDFDTPTFLANAKKQFAEIQAIWDSGNVAGLSEYLTDDLIAEMKPQIEARGGKAEHTEIVLLNAELLGIETVSGGHLASVRYSGMLREAPGAEAFRFEEVWNLYKADGQGWLLAGIQQIPVEGQ